MVSVANERLVFMRSGKDSAVVYKLTNQLGPTTRAPGFFWVCTTDIPRRSRDTRDLKKGEYATLFESLVGAQINHTVGLHYSKDPHRERIQDVSAHTGAAGNITLSCLSGPTVEWSYSFGREVKRSRAFLHF